MLDVRDALARTRTELARTGLLMQHDARLPSVTTLVAGAPVRGSWWSHPKGHEIFAVLQAVAPDVAFVKLVAHKVTLVHPRLWPALAAIGNARHPWQVASLPADAATVLTHVAAHARVATTELTSPSTRPIAKIVTDLEQRLLIHSEQEHTASGKHVRVLTSWTAWATAHDLDPTLLSVTTAMRTFEAAIGDWPHAKPLLPWSSAR
jgi:hypothetical protein